MIVRIALTVPNTALAGVTLESSLARFKASTAAFSEERATSRRFGRWDFVSMVEARGKKECGFRLRGRTRTLIEMSGHPVIACLAQTFRKVAVEGEMRRSADHPEPLNCSRSKHPYLAYFELGLSGCSARSTSLRHPFLPSFLGRWPSVFVCCGFHGDRQRSSSQPLLSFPHSVVIICWISNTDCVSLTLQIPLYGTSRFC